MTYVHPHKVLAKDIDVEYFKVDKSYQEYDFGHVPGFLYYNPDRKESGREAWEAYKNIRNRLMQRDLELALFRKVKFAENLSPLELLEVLKYLKGE